MHTELDCNQVGIQLRYLCVANAHQFRAPSLVCIIGISAFLEHDRQFNLLAENVLREGFGFLGFIAFLVSTEILEVAAVVKNKETLFVGIFSVYLIGAGKPLAQTSTAANHLPKLCFGTNLLKEYEVNALRHIDAGVHHIHGYGNNRFLVRHLEIVNKGLRVCIVADHALGESSVILGVQLIEALQNELCMALVLGEDDGFSQSVASGHANTALH